MTFRQEHDALRLGKITFPDNHAHLLSAIRHHSEETCVGVFNLSSRKRRWHPPTALAGSTVQQVLQTNTTPLQSLKSLTLQPGEGFIAVL